MYIGYLSIMNTSLKKHTIIIHLAYCVDLHFHAIHFSLSVMNINVRII